ncbi:bifunctional UDP-sugar hydrolase/5'-nucleotidase [Brevibacillus parabrevis]|uniref:bifunctional metallophosphatase/5'-nucleotidase n=1 Tax=Brevibacillus parabrevis TaxID=54914 RepID=UPI002E24D65B|nr:bifunctional UDP-sugar hydrolase/5'-nucleotidase [Brevibacillus parabrevis]
MADTWTLHLLHTNDLHSHFEKMPQIATCLKTSRQLWEAQQEHVLTVDIGDHMDRMDVRSEASFGKANVQVMNRCGYQYATIGNNEGITLPKEKLDEMYEQADFTVIIGNLLDKASSAPPQWAVPYAIHTFGELRVALLGMTIPFSTYQSLGWEILDPLPLIREQVAALRSSADIFILLSHLGYQTDCRIAAEVEGLDVILGGHTHHTLPHGERVGNTLIAQTGRFGEHVGHIRLVWDRDGKQIADVSAELFDTASYAPDEALRDFLQKEKAAADASLFQPIAELEQDLHVNWTEETPFGSFLAASIRRWTKAEVGIANGGLLLSDLHQGRLTFAQLLESVPHPINACAVTLTGEQLASVLEQAIQPQIVHRELRGCGFRGKIEGWMAVDGLRIRYEESGQPHILAIEVNGQPLIREREYRVGTVDMFMYNRLFPDLLQGREIEFFHPEMLREVIASTITDRTLVQSAFLPRWEKVSPESSGHAIE